MSQTRLYFTAPKQVATDIAGALDPIFDEAGVPTALFEDTTDQSNWTWSVYLSDEDVDENIRKIEHLFCELGFDEEIQREELGDVDWVSHTLRELSPVSAGRFFVHGSHDRVAAENKRLPVEIDAGLAFGTGHHGTTAGCLDLLEDCLRLTKPRRAMDVGTGSGVLAIALAKACHIPVLATDIDPVSVTVSKQNSQNNGVATHIRFATAAGFENRAFSAFGKADLLFANILARPLEKLARPMQQHLAPGAYVILSGLLPHQRARIVNAYTLQGLTLQKWHIRDDWLSILMRKPV